MSSLKIICLYISPSSGQIRLLSIIIASDRGQTLCLKLSLWYLHPQTLGLQPLWFVRLCNLLAVNRVLVLTPTSDNSYVTFWWIAFSTMSCVFKYGVVIVTYHKILLCIVLLSGRFHLPLLYTNGDLLAGWSGTWAPYSRGVECIKSGFSALLYCRVCTSLRHSFWSYCVSIVGYHQLSRALLCQPNTWQLLPHKRENGQLL